ncbi:hypothetical protein COLO4_10221 [Corchorus olitorius]|uniref:Uncharacterized protein n=1 Tax=Corchorus olitorius TaxID=93759 RepID=A0A1R3K9M4_9ROSI|nr:hypothetical protein COLO4_10221 [Corchorus olitorius]
MSTMPEEVGTSLNETTRRKKEQPRKPARSTAGVSKNGANAEAEYSGDGTGYATAQFASENDERTNGHASANVNTYNQTLANASTPLHEELNVAPVPREENPRHVRVTVNRATTPTQGEASSSKKSSKQKKHPKANCRAPVGRVILDNDGKVISSTEPEFRTSPKSVAKMQGRSGNPNVQRNGPDNLQSVATSTVGSQPSGASTCIGGSNKQSKEAQTTKKRTRMQGIGLLECQVKESSTFGGPNRKKTRTHTDQLHGTQESGVEDSSIQSHNPSKTGKGKQKDPWRL